MSEETRIILKSYKKLMEIEDQVDEMSFNIDHDCTAHDLELMTDHLIYLVNELKEITHPKQIIEVEANEEQSL